MEDNSKKLEKYFKKAIDKAVNEWYYIGRSKGTQKIIQQFGKNIYNIVTRKEQVSVC